MFWNWIQCVIDVAKIDDRQRGKMQRLLKFVTDFSVKIKPHVRNKVQRALAERGFSVSTKTIQRIYKDLDFIWTNPWYTDVLTSAQKKKREIFCRNLMTLTEEELLQRISGWLWTDEKWWDIVGPSSSQWCKAKSKLEVKQQNQVCCV